MILVLAKRHRCENFPWSLLLIHESTNSSTSPSPRPRLRLLRKQIPPPVAKIRIHILHQPQPLNLPDHTLSRGLLDRDQAEIGGVLGGRVVPLDPFPAVGSDLGFEISPVLLRGLVLEEPNDVIVSNRRG